MVPSLLFAVADSAQMYSKRKRGSPAFHALPEEESDEAGRSRAESALKDNVTDLFLSGKINGQEAASLARAVDATGVTGMKDIAEAGFTRHGRFYANKTIIASSGTFWTPSGLGCIGPTSPCGPTSGRIL